MRQVTLDTETTGLDVSNGHRVIEIGCTEIIDRKFTGEELHFYLNPERDSDKRAQEVHGLSREFLKDKPKFSEIADEFINYISNSKIIIHNASFDVGFLNAELIRCNMKELNDDIIIDTLVLARKKFIGQSVSLDSLCRKYNIDLTGREIHGAIKDAKLLASVYLELIGGRQSRLDLERIDDSMHCVERDHLFNLDEYYEKQSNIRKSRFKIDEKEYKLHLDSIKTIKNSIWDRISN